MSAVYTGKISGLTAAAATVATQDVTLDSDGWLRWTDANGDKHGVQLSGHLGQLIATIFTGVGGISHTILQ